MVKPATRQHGDSIKTLNASQARTSASLRGRGRVAKTIAQAAPAIAPTPRTSASRGARSTATPRARAARGQELRSQSYAVTSDTSTSSAHVNRVIDTVATASHPTTLQQQRDEILFNHQPICITPARRSPSPWRRPAAPAAQARQSTDSDAVSVSELRDVLSSFLLANQKLMTTIASHGTATSDSGRSYPKHVQFAGKKDEDFDLWLENFLARTKRIRQQDPTEHLELFRAS